MILEIILLIFYKLLLDFSYINYVGVMYSYQGFNADLDLIKVLESTLSVVLLYIFYRINNNKIHAWNILLLILIVSVFVPYSSLYGMENTNRFFYYLIFISFLITIGVTKIPAVRLPTISSINQNILLKGLISFSIIFLVLLILNEGMPRIYAFDLNNVYAIRRENSIPKLLTYFLNWQTKVVTLFIIGHSLYYKKKKTILFMLILQTLIYAISPHKMILFAPLLLIGLYFILNIFKNFRVVYILFMNVGIVLSFLLYRYNISEWPATLFIRRMLFVPVKNTSYVFEYFYDIEKIKLSNSILKGIFIYPFDKGVYYMIGEEYYNNPLTNANANYIADSYLQFGVLGILLYSLLLGFLLWILKSVAFGKPTIIVLGATLIGFYSIIDSSLLTSMLTNGIILGMFLSLILKKYDKPLIHL